ncbi:hypothetical protein [Actinomadura sp. 3N508]|uniref:hypothetical protein n=1 Tax=Actinomadura sp. 3N508 TaxID=3375153 RepID=UPI003792597E
MADVFTRLARRAIGDEPGFRPKLPARFEPTASFAGFATHDTGHPDADFAGSRRPEDSAGAGPQTAAGPPGQAPPLPRAERAATPPPADAAPRVSTPSPAQARPPDTRAVPPPPEKLAEPSRAADEPVRPPAAPDGVRPRAQGEPRRGRSGAGDPHRVRPVPPEPDIALPPRRPPAAPAGSAEPDVHISIGRVEVRTVPVPPERPAPAPAAPPPAAPPAPGLSLADYLRGDDGRPR